MQVKSMILILVLSLFFSSKSFCAESSKYRLKDGRQFTLDLVRTFDIPHEMLRPLFRQVRSSLPKKGDLSEFYAAKDSMAKLASYACDYVDFLEGPNLTLVDTYKMIFDRAPTKVEVENAILSNGKFSFYENCFFLTMSPEYILIKK
ncbi:MAG: hypothetical protein KDD40_00735 [Bdellovibrionales bacterium]|nr:hypothetical protein [Bdellovibrionales bacterium]